MEDGPGHRGAVGLGHGLRPPPRNNFGQTRMKRLSENGARPVTALGEWNTQPFSRLGALVFQPNNSEPLYWASLWAPTRIAGCALGDCPTDTRWENVSPERRSASSFDHSGPRGRTPPPVRFGNKGACADRRTISFSLWTVFAEHSRGTPGSSTGSCRERMHPQSTDGLSAQVALLQSPILSAAGAQYRFSNAVARQTKTMT
jgi:hypothetical protein